MSKSNEYIDYLLDLLTPLGPVSARAMFGGFGIYLHGIMFGLVADNTLYLKADAATRPDFEVKGLPPFTYSRQGQEYAMSYFQAPPEAMEESVMLCSWAAKAHGVALRAAAGKKKARTS